MRESHADMHLSAGGGTGGAPGSGADTALQAVVQPMLRRQLCPAAHGGPGWSRDPPAAWA